MRFIALVILFVASGASTSSFANCIQGGKFTPADVLAMDDYTKCSTDELRSFESAMHDYLRERKHLIFSQRNDLSTLVGTADIGAAKGSLLMIREEMKSR